MRIIDGMAYGGELLDMDPTVVSASKNGSGSMLVTFSNGETRVFKSSKITEFPVFRRLADDSVFFDFKIEDGVMTWENGKVDLAPETMFELSEKVS